MMKILVTCISILLNSIASHAQLTDSLRLKALFDRILDQPTSRDFEHTATLDSVADYIHSIFSQHCDTTYYQEYQVEGKTYRNVIGRMGDLSAPRIVIGAHYDVCGDQQGADDNGSGVVGLLELVRILEKDTLEHQLEFVAFTLEEPPFFRTEQMGSYIHARSLIDDSIQVLGMVCLEMIGYFSDEEDSQAYPIPSLKMIYGDKGDYITLVQKSGSIGFSNKFCKQFVNCATIKTERFKGPQDMQGIDFSDHLNYWAVDIPALMITDTAFFRNRNYHTHRDTLEKLDLNRMAMVIETTALTLRQLDL